MEDFFKHFDAMTMLLWVAPGAFFALFRSFAMRGTFPRISKDDIAALLLGSVVYYFILFLIVDLTLSYKSFAAFFSPLGLFLVLLLGPAIAGIGLGYLEASDVIGLVARRIGIRLPSPDSTAWETLFRELPPHSILMVSLKDGTQVIGRWSGGKNGSASSSDTSIMDLYVGQIGFIDTNGDYIPHTPQRGVYFAASEIRTIEVVLAQTA